MAIDDKLQEFIDSKARTGSRYESIEADLSDWVNIRDVQELVEECLGLCSQTPFKETYIQAAIHDGELRIDGLCVAYLRPNADKIAWMKLRAALNIDDYDISTESNRLHRHAREALKQVFDLSLKGDCKAVQALLQQLIMENTPEHLKTDTIKG